MTNIDRIEKLAAEQNLPDEDLYALLTSLTEKEEELLYARARAVRERHYDKAVYLRGLIEFSNYCRNDCYYCGIRAAASGVSRYRLSADEILACCNQGYALGFRTFVLQSGEDLTYSCTDICHLVSAIKEAHPDCAVTLSIGEKTREEYEAYFDAGADRYLLREETADPVHYVKLHPPALSGENRKRCLYDLKEIGYQVGAGFMVGSPGQTAENIIADLRFLQSLTPHMIGIGPFIHAGGTPFAHEPDGTLTDTLHLLGILRLLFPRCLLPATTALGTIDPRGREKGILAGANVVMPNLSPRGVRDKYLLYDGKICTGDEAAECCNCMEMRIASTGYQVVVSRGDYCQG